MLSAAAARLPYLQHGTCLGTSRRHRLLRLAPIFVAVYADGLQYRISFHRSPFATEQV